MRLPNAGPEDGPLIEFDWFNNWGVAGGEKHFAYFAGGSQWFIAHPSDLGSKPCLTWMTKGALPCRFCACHKEPCRLGYVPVWRAVDSRPLFLIVYEDEHEHCEKLRLHERLVVGREREKGARIWIRKAIDPEPRFQTALLRRMRAQDITKSLLRIWKLPELTAWLVRADDNGLSLPDAPMCQSSGEPFGPMTKAAAARFQPRALKDELPDDEYSAVLRRAKDRVEQRESEKNGKHKPK